MYVVEFKGRRIALSFVLSESGECLPDSLSIARLPCLKSKAEAKIVCSALAELFDLNPLDLNFLMIDNDFVEV